MKDSARIEEILDRLPQMQCGRCGFENCREYAEAIASGTPPDRCAPGGRSGIRLLAGFLGIPEMPLDETYGTEGPLCAARIDESFCTGCMLCIQACPFDAIIGTGKMMHTVITPLCTGCTRCVSRCPMDCIELVPVSGEKTGRDAWPEERAIRARARYERRKTRLSHEEKEAEAKPAAKAAGKADFMKSILARAAAGKKAKERP